MSTAVYPTLTPYVSATRVSAAQTNRGLALSAQTVADHAGHFAGAAVTANGEEACAYFVLDAHSEIIVFTPIAADSPTPEGVWPPPRESALRQHVTALKSARAVTPRLVYARAVGTKRCYIAGCHALSDPLDCRRASRTPGGLTVGCSKTSGLGATQAGRRS